MTDDNIQSPASSGGAESNPPSLEELIASGEEKLSAIDSIRKTSSGTSSPVAGNLSSSDPEDDSSISISEVLKKKMRGEDGAEKKSLFSKIGSFFKKKEEKPAPGTGDHLVSGDEGNVFTKMFEEDRKTTPEEVLIQNIISQSRKKKEEERGQKKQEEKKEDNRNILDLKNQTDSKNLLSSEEGKQKKAREILQLSKIVAGSSLIVPIISFLLSGLFLSTSGFLSRLIEQKNYGIILEDKNTKLSRILSDIEMSKKDIALYAGKIAEIQDNQVLGTIMNKRINWREVFEMIEDTTNKTFKGNTVSRYVTYSTYSGNSETMKLSISGEIRAPEGTAMKSQILLKNALNDHDNFDGVEIKNFSKSPCTTKGKTKSSEYCSPFTFAFLYLKDSDDLDSMKAAPKE